MDKDLEKYADDITVKITTFLASIFLYKKGIITEEDMLKKFEDYIKTLYGNNGELVYDGVTKVAKKISDKYEEGVKKNE